MRIVLTPMVAVHVAVAPVVRGVHEGITNRRGNFGDLPVILLILVIVPP